MGDDRGESSEISGKKNLAMTYIERRQATVEQWMVLRPVLKVCAGDKGYKGGGRRRDFLVVPRGNKNTTSGNLGRRLTEGKEEETKWQ